MARTLASVASKRNDPTKCRGGWSGALHDAGSARGAAMQRYGVGACGAPYRHSGRAMSPRGMQRGGGNIHEQATRAGGSVAGGS